MNENVLRLYTMDRIEKSEKLTEDEQKDLLNYVLEATDEQLMVLLLDGKKVGDMNDFTKNVVKTRFENAGFVQIVNDVDRLKEKISQKLSEEFKEAQFKKAPQYSKKPSMKARFDRQKAWQAREDEKAKNMKARFDRQKAWQAREAEKAKKLATMINKADEKKE